ncbi:MAG: ribonuclease H [Nannocystaceae bacterium]
MPWKQYEFKGQTVYVRVLPTGKPIVRHGRVELRYKLGARKSYKAAPDNLEPAEGEIISDTEMSGTTGAAAATAALRETPTTAADAETIIVYTDGACSGNPGPAGIGVFVQRPTQTVEISEFLGSGTNNIAELTAILRGLQALREEDQDRLVHLYTDSGWSLGVLIGGWKAKANLSLIEEIRAEMKRFPRLELLKVKGHAGNDGNEEADRLATQATRREASSEPRVRRRRPS